MEIVLVVLAIGLMLVIFAPMALLPAISGSDDAAHASVRLSRGEPPCGCGPHHLRHTEHRKAGRLAEDAPHDNHAAA